MSPLAANVVLVVAGGIAALSAVILVLVVFAPSRRVRSEPRLDEEIETRLLLGEDPEDLDRELAARDEETTPVAELRRPDEATGS